MATAKSAQGSRGAGRPCPWGEPGGARPRALPIRWTTVARAMRGTLELKRTPAPRAAAEEALAGGNGAPTSELAGGTGAPSGRGCRAELPRVSHRKSPPRTAKRAAHGTVVREPRLVTPADSPPVQAVSQRRASSTPARYRRRAQVRCTRRAPSAAPAAAPSMMVSAPRPAATSPAGPPLPCTPLRVARDCLN